MGLQQTKRSAVVRASTDSVFQIAAHEKLFGSKRLHRFCGIAGSWADDYGIDSVIDRSFKADAVAFGNFQADLPSPESNLLHEHSAAVTGEHGCGHVRPAPNPARVSVPVSTFDQKLASGGIDRRDAFAEVGPGDARRLPLTPMAAGTFFL